MSYCRAPRNLIFCHKFCSCASTAGVAATWIYWNSSFSETIDVTGIERPFEKQQNTIPFAACAMRSDREGRDITQKELYAMSGSSYFQRTLVEHDDKGKVYDGVFHLREGYEPRVSRDDKAVNRTLNINKQERDRKVPVLSSSVYGWHVHKPLEALDKKNVRVQMINKGFFRSRGVCIPLETEIGELNEECKPQ